MFLECLIAQITCQRQQPQGKGRPHDLDVLLGVAGNMEGRTICVFADAAAWPVQSYITKFRDEFEYHVRKKRCHLSDALSAAAVAGIIP